MITFRQLSHSHCGECGSKNNVLMIELDTSPFRSSFKYTFCYRCLLQEMKRQIHSYTDFNKPKCVFCSENTEHMAIIFDDYIICKDCNIKIIESTLDYLESEV